MEGEKRREEREERMHVCDDNEAARSADVEAASHEDSSLLVMGLLPVGAATMPGAVAAEVLSLSIPLCLTFCLSCVCLSLFFSFFVSSLSLFLSVLSES